MPNIVFCLGSSCIGWLSGTVRFGNNGDMTHTSGLTLNSSDDKNRITTPGPFPTWLIRGEQKGFVQRRAAMTSANDIGCPLNPGSSAHSHTLRRAALSLKYTPSARPSHFPHEMQMALVLSNRYPNGAATLRVFQPSFGCHFLNLLIRTTLLARERSDGTGDAAGIVATRVVRPLVAAIRPCCHVANRSSVAGVKPSQA